MTPDREPRTASSPPDREDHSSAPELAPATRKTSLAAVWLVGLLLVIVPTLSLPENAVWGGARTLVLEAVAILVAVYTASVGQWSWARVRAALLAPTNLALLGFLIWLGISVARPDVAPVLKKLSQYDGMRYLSGALLYFAVVYGFGDRRSIQTLVQFMLAGAIAGSLIAFTEFTSGGRNIEGAFNNVELFSGFLGLLLPVTIMAAVVERRPGWRIAAQIAAVTALAGILAARNRSSWFGCAVALLFLAGLYLRYAGNPIRSGLRKHHLVMPLVALVAAVGLFAWLSRTQAIQARAESLATIAQDDSFRYRIGMASKAIRMIRDHPYLGTGIGTFRVQQALYFHPHGGQRSQKDILAAPRDGENAHNHLLHLGAEIGLPGMAVYLFFFLAFFGTGIRALRRSRPGYRQAMLMASLAAVAGGLVTVMGNPAWEFAQCSLFVWLMLGMGMAIAGVGQWPPPAKGERRRGPEDEAEV